MIDDEISSIGSANMDFRSFELNFEVNAFIYDEDIAKQLRQAFEKDIEQSKLLQKKYTTSVHYQLNLKKD